MMSPQFPQLQRTFVKCLSDISSLSVRNRAATALGVLMLHQPRIDPLITELTNAISTEEAEVRDSMANGLAGVIVSGGKNLSEDSKSAILNLLGEAFGETNKGQSHLLPSLRRG
jgi:HEAT repeat protein